MKIDVSFLPGILFGASTSAHQVEDNTNNDWSLWEALHAHKWSKRDGNFNYGCGPAKNFQAFKAQIKTPANYLSGMAVNHYNDYAVHLKLAADTGLSAYRFSIEWSRIEPIKGHYDLAAIAHYVAMARAARDNGLEPFVTLWHWTLPLWASDQGGMESTEVRNRFYIYARKMVEAMQDHVSMWLTINEPEVYSFTGYVLGVWPPGRHNPFKYFKLMNHLVELHIKTYTMIKTINGGLQVSAAVNQVDYQSSASGKPIAYLLRKWGNDYFHNQTAYRHQDFIALNFYMKDKVTRFVRQFDNGPEEKSDLGWGLHPKSLYNVLVRLKQHNLPIYITEHGLADARDELREAYIRSSLYYVWLALRDGCDIRGYLHWSLLSGLEWDKGRWPDFGLIYVDPETFECTVRESAKAYGKIARDRGFDFDPAELIRWG